MPYASVSELPSNVRSKLPPKKQRQWMHVWNSEYDAHGDESRAFASAWSAVGKKVDIDRRLMALGSRNPGVLGRVKEKLEMQTAQKFASGETFNLFLPLAKVEKQKDGSCIVSGYASTESLDLDGEIVSRDAIKSALPGYWQWRNIREMHAPRAVGVAQEYSMDEKGLFLTSKIIDKDAVTKCLEGVYKGYSIGGRKLDKIGNTITEIELIEISVVDRPANPECRISVAKSAKESDAEAFLVKLRSPRDPRSKALNQMAKAVQTLAKADPPAGHDGFSLPAKTEKAGPCEAHGKENCPDCMDKREFSSEQRDSAASSGAALPDGSFPIENKSDLENAIRAFGRAKDKAKAKRHIISRARALGATDSLPDKWSKKLAKKEAKKLAKQAQAQAQSSAPVSAEPSFLTLPAEKSTDSDLGLLPDEISTLGIEVGSGHELDLGGEWTPPQEGQLWVPDLPSELGKTKALFTKSQWRMLKSMGVTGQLCYCFDSIRTAQRSLIVESSREGGDMKDRDLATQLGQIAQTLAVVIGQKAEHEGAEALDLSDADDQNFYGGNLTEIMQMSAKGLDLGNVLVEMLKRGGESSLGGLIKSGRMEIKKARKTMGDVEECIKSAHAMHKAAYLAKQAVVKAGKKPKDDGDADDFDHQGAMEKLNKAFGDIQTMKTFMKAAGEQLKKASGRVDQGEGTVFDGTPDYQVPPGIKPLSFSDMLSGPGGHAPHTYQLDRPADKSARGVRPRVYTEAELETAKKVAALEAENATLKSAPAAPVHGRKPFAFDVGKFGATTTPPADTAAGLLSDPVVAKGVDFGAFSSGDENRHTHAAGVAIGNMLLAGKGARNVFDSDFHGTAGGKPGVA